jgi:hypothetical protein
MTHQEAKSIAPHLGLTLRKVRCHYAAGAGWERSTFCGSGLQVFIVPASRKD